MQRSKLVLGVVVALGVGGFGAAAVAMESDGGVSSSHHTTTTTTEVVADTTTTTTVAPTTTTVAPTTTTVAPTTEDPVSDGDGGTGGVERSTDGCDGGTYANHGDFVSSVAHNPDRQPGDVAAAAQSDCGKPITAVGGGADDPPTTPDTVAPSTPGIGAGNGNANGNGNGGGHGRP